MSGEDVGAVWTASGLDAGSLASLLELSHDAAFVRGPDRTIVFWNLGAEELYGWSKADALGQVSHDLLATQFDQPLEDIELQLLANGRWEGRLRHRTKDGRIVTVESRWAMHVAPGRRLAAVLEVNRDITERLAEAARFRALADAVSEAVFIHEDGRILDVNRNACVLLGYREDELRAMHILDLIAPADVERVRANLQAQTEVPFESRVVRADGVELTVETSGRTVAYDGRTVRVVVARVPPTGFEPVRRP